jgi:hypothetical protein
MGKSMKHQKGLFFLALLLAGALALAGAAWAVEVGDSAPDFKLASTNGVDISLNDFRGKKWVFLEFYGGAFVPT